MVAGGRPRRNGCDSFAVEATARMRTSGLDAETLRALALDSLRRESKTQWVTFALSVTSRAREQRLLGPTDDLSPAEEDTLQAIVWALITQGVLVPGPSGGSSGQGWPFFRVTPFGLEALKAPGAPPPHDPDGFLRRLKAEVPGVAANADYDLYVGEALNCFVAGNHLATVLLVGVAAELAAVELADAMIHWIPAKEAEAIAKLENWKVAERFEEMRKRLVVRRPKLPKSYAEDFDVQLLGIAAVLRRSRNEAGHPTGRAYSRAEAFNVLQMLPFYLKFLHGLAAWMRRQPAASG